MIGDRHKDICLEHRIGQEGPYRDRMGYETVFQALSGVVDLTGYPDARLSRWACPSP